MNMDKIDYTDEQYIEDHADSIDWNFINENHKYITWSQSLIDKFHTEINFKIIAYEMHSGIFPIEFIKRSKNYIDWNLFSRCRFEESWGDKNFEFVKSNLSFFEKNLEDLNEFLIENPSYGSPVRSKIIFFEKSLLYRHG